MFSFLIRKMVNNKWMIISLLVGNILLVATVTSVPLYKSATLNRMLIKEMQEYQSNEPKYFNPLEDKDNKDEVEEYPALLELMLIFKNTEATGMKNFINIRENLNNEILNAFGAPTIAVVENLALSNAQFLNEVQRKEKPVPVTATVSARTDFEKHAKITQGRMFSEDIVDGVIEAVVSQRTFDYMDLLLDEILVTKKQSIMGGPLRIRITGVYTNSEENDPYWTSSPNTNATNLVISHSLIEKIILNDPPDSLSVTATWEQVYDYNYFKISDIQRFVDADEKYQSIKTLNTNYILTYKNTFVPILSSYLDKESSLSVTLMVLQVPVFMLLAFFIYMVSRQILKIEQNDISVIKSRGAAKKQIITIYFLQSLIICAVSIPLSLPLGIFICKVLGSSNGFLNLVQRSALNVYMVPDAFFYAGLASVFSLLTMTLPVYSYSKVTIVDHKRAKSAGGRKPVWQMFFLDFLALGISVYSLYSLSKRQEAYTLNINGINSVDPLIFLSSSLFILGMGLVVLRLYPYLIKLIYTVFKKAWPPAFYASFLRLIRSGGDEQFIMIFLVFTLAVGIFDAKAARTINLNNEDKIRYETGADLVYKEKWKDNSIYGNAGVRLNQDRLVYTEPDFGRFTSFPEVESAARVYESYVTLTLRDGKLPNVTMMSVNTKEFGETAWYRNDLFSAHFYDYLNSLASDPAAVLLSSNLKDKYKLKLKDEITFKNEYGDEFKGVIHGFVDYWPGFENVSRYVADDGKVVESDNWLIVTNLHYIQAQMGLIPYEVWMKTSEETNNFFYGFVNENLAKITDFADSKAQVVASRSAPLLQGMNGVLTVGFIIIVIVCATGFLIYWILAIKSRVLQFGVFRAMGMRFKNVIGMLVIEQTLITGAGIALGVLVGEVASRLFVPIIQLAYTASEKVIPLLIVTQMDDYIRLLGIIGFMILFCLCLLGVFVSRIKIAQALKLGED